MTGSIEQDERVLTHVSTRSADRSKGSGAEERKGPQSVSGLMTGFLERTGVIKKKYEKKGGSGPRSFAITWTRLRLLSVLVEKTTLSTQNAALLSGMSRHRAFEALQEFAKRGWVTTKKSGRSHAIAWTITVPGLGELVRGMRHRCTVVLMGSTALRGSSHMLDGTARTSLLLEAAQQVAKRLKKLGWFRKLRNTALNIYRPDTILRQIKEIEKLTHVRNPGALLRFRLLNFEVHTKRRAGLARKVVPEHLRLHYLAITRETPPKFYVHLAYAIRRLAKHWPIVGTGDVTGVAEHLAKRHRIRLP